MFLRGDRFLGEQFMAKFCVYGKVHFDVSKF